MCQIFANQDPANYACETRRVRLNGQSTSVRLERAFWSILDEIAEGEGVSTPAFLSKLHSEVLEQRGEVFNFSSLLRCACLVHKERTGKAGMVAQEVTPDRRRSLLSRVVFGYYPDRNAST